MTPPIMAPGGRLVRRVYRGSQWIPDVRRGGQLVHRETFDTTPVPVDAYVAASSSASLGDGGTAILPAPSGVQPGDLLIAAYVGDYGAATLFGPPSGFTQLQNHQGSTTGPVINLAWRVATASEPTSYGIPTFNIDADGAGTIVAIRDWSGTWDDLRSVAATSASSATVVTTPSATPATDRSLVLAFGGRNAGAAGATYSWAAPSGMTMVAQRNQTDGWASIAAARQTRNLTTATGTRAFGLTSNQAARIGLGVTLTIPSGVRAGGMAEVDAAFENVTSIDLSSTGAQTIARPAGVEENDLLLFTLSATSSSDGPSEAPTGFTTLQYREFSATGFRQIVAFKRATASEPTSYTYKRGAGAAARVDLARITGAATDVDPVAVVTATASSNTTYPGLAVTPPAGSERNLILAIGSRPGAGVETETFNWQPPAGYTEHVDRSAWSWVTQTIASARHDVANATAAPTFGMTTNAATARSGIVTTVAVPSGVRSVKPPSGGGYVAAPTLPSGNLASKTDLTAAVYTNPAGTTSTFHRYASHLQGDGPYPLVIHLHGDGAYEYNNPTTFVSPQYMQVARDLNAVGAIPLTPEPSQGSGYQVTWWKRLQDSVWLANFIQYMYEVYNIDRKRVYLSGFSGGSVVLTADIFADWPELFEGGGGIMLGGGTAYTSAVSPTAQMQQNTLLRWHVGELDDGRNTLDNYNARAAAEASEAKYRSDGWDTRLTLIPGKAHSDSMVDGPPALRALVNESSARYGLPQI